MRIDVFFSDRVGIAQEVLAELARRSFNVTAVEVAPPHIFIEAPELDARSFNALREHMLLLKGVLSVETVGMPTYRIAHLGIGYCPEERGIFASLSCEENLMLPPVLSSGGKGMSVDEIYADPLRAP